MIILSIVLLLSILGNVVLSIVINKTLIYSQERELNIEVLVPLLREFKIACDDLLNREIYSNDPVIQNFVARLIEINGLLKNINENYNIEQE